jgi:hypothetical protein
MSNAFEDIRRDRRMGGIDCPGAWIKWQPVTSAVVPYPAGLQGNYSIISKAVAGKHRIRQLEPGFLSDPRFGDCAVVFDAPSSVTDGLSQ